MIEINYRSSRSGFKVFGWFMEILDSCKDTKLDVGLEESGNEAGIRHVIFWGSYLWTWSSGNVSHGGLFQEVNPSDQVSWEAIRVGVLVTTTNPSNKSHNLGTVQFIGISIGHGLIYYNRLNRVKWSESFQSSTRIMGKSTPIKEFSEWWKELLCILIVFVWKLAIVPNTIDQMFFTFYKS